MLQSWCLIGRSGSIVSIPRVSARKVTFKTTRSPVIELIRTLPKPDFCDIVDHSPNQRCCSEVWRGYPTVVFPSQWADSQLPSSLVIKLGRATVDPRTSHSRYFESTCTNGVHVSQGRVHGEYAGIQASMLHGAIGTEWQVAIPSLL